MSKRFEELRRSMTDNYAHVESSIMYSEINIPGPGCSVEHFHIQYEKGCDCTAGDCSDSRCACVSRYGRNYTSNGILMEGKTNGPVVECNSECLCCKPESVNESDLQDNTDKRNAFAEGDLEIGHCQNRLVQFGPMVGLEVYVTRNKGFGLKSCNRIPRGTFICEYAGEVIGLEEARRRSKRKTQDMNYVFVLNEHIGNTKIIKTCVDPGHVGNIGRYINHSCQPNSVIVPVRVDNPVPRLAIFSCCDIDVGEEITFDYGGGEATGPVETSAKRKLCKCGNEKCRVYLPFDESLL